MKYYVMKCYEIKAEGMAHAASKMSKLIEIDLNGKFKRSLGEVGRFTRSV